MVFPMDGANHGGGSKVILYDCGWVIGGIAFPLFAGAAESRAVYGKKYFKRAYRSRIDLLGVRCHRE